MDQEKTTTIDFNGLLGLVPRSVKNNTTYFNVLENFIPVVRKVNLHTEICNIISTYCGLDSTNLNSSLVVVLSLNIQRTAQLHH